MRPLRLGQGTDDRPDIHNVEDNSLSGLITAGQSSSGSLLPGDPFQVFGRELKK